MGQPAIHFELTERAQRVFRAVRGNKHNISFPAGEEIIYLPSLGDEFQLAGLIDATFIVIKRRFVWAATAEGNATIVLWLDVVEKGPMMKPVDAA